MANSKPSTSFINLAEVFKKNLNRQQIKLHPTIKNDRIPVQLLINCLRILMFKGADQAESMIQELEEDLDKTISLEDIDKMIDKAFRNVDNMYVQSIDQLKRNVKSMIGTVGIPMLSSGVGSINFSSEFYTDYQGSKQGCLALVAYVLTQINMTNTDETSDIQEFLLDQHAHEMKYFEFVEVPITVLGMKVMDISKRFNNQSENQKRCNIINAFIGVHGYEDDMVGTLCSLIFDETEYHKRKMIEMKLRRKMERKDLREDAKYVTKVLNGYLTSMLIIDELKNTDFLKSNYDVSPENLKIPYLANYYFANSQLPSSGAIPQQYCFVFRKDVDMNIMIRQKFSGKYTEKTADTSDSKFIDCVSLEEAIREIVEACGNVEIQSYVTVQPEVGFYSAPPIVSPYNTLCKPVFIIFRDFFNFLIYELNILKAIKDEHIDDFKSYVLRFCDEFQVTREGLFCIDWLEFCKFLEEGRILFEGKLEDNVEKTYIPTKEDVDLYGSKFVIEKMRENVKPGVLEKYNNAISFYEDSGEISKMDDGHRMADFAIMVAFLEEFPDLCTMVHRQNACHKLQFCALEFHEEYSMDQYCIQRKKPIEPQPAIKYHNALRQLLFPKVFNELPKQVLKKLENPRELVGFEDFQKTTLSNIKFFEPISEKMYCQNIDEMWSILTTISSSYTAHLSPRTVPVINNGDIENTNGLMIIDKADLQSALFPNFIRLLNIKTPIMEQLLEYELSKIGSCHGGGEFVINDEKLKEDFQKVFHKHNRYNLSMPQPVVIPTSWLTEKSLEQILKEFFEIIFDHNYDGKAMLMKEIREEVNESSSRVERICEIFGTSMALRKAVQAIYQDVPDHYYKSYWKSPMKTMPRAILKINVIKDGDKQHKFVFKKDLQLAIRMTTKKTDIYNYDKDDKEYEDKINAYKYIDYDEAMEVIRKECGTTVLTKEMVVKMHGYKSCVPILSPLNTLCKPYHIVIREFFNFLNYEINIFRLIFDTHFNNLRFFIRDFIERYLPASKAPCCIELDSIKGALREKMNQDALLLSAISDKKIKQMYIPTVEELTKCGVAPLIKKLKTNSKPGLLRAHDSAIDCISDKLVSSVDNSDIGKLADEAMYRSFIMEIPLLCKIMHNQGQCGSWSQCTMSFTDDRDVTRCEAGENGVFHKMEQEFAGERMLAKMEKININC